MNARCKVQLLEFLTKLDEAEAAVLVRVKQLEERGEAEGEVVIVDVVERELAQERIQRVAQQLLALHAVHGRPRLLFLCCADGADEAVEEDGHRNLQQSPVDDDKVADGEDGEGVVKRAVLSNLGDRADPGISGSHRKHGDEGEVVGSEVVWGNVAEEVDAHDGVYGGDEVDDEEGVKDLAQCGVSRAHAHTHARAHTRTQSHTLRLWTRSGSAEVTTHVFLVSYRATSRRYLFLFIDSHPHLCLVLHRSTGLLPVCKGGRNPRPPPSQ
mmetsp:Transcript_59961/g.125408  ORF Transcript_59961/g.125408 Transcript_59961/m.125408 type:complete len:269 (-) Transcript_59961:1705-2511(-)